MSQKSEELLRTGSQELMGELEGQMQDFGEEFQVTDQVKDLLATFKEETDGLFASSEGEVDSSSVIGGLRDAFAGFIASLGSLAPTDDAGEAATGGVVVGETTVADNGVPIAENDPAVVETDSTEPEGFATTEEPDAFSLALQDLQEWFDTEISAMEKTVDDLHVTPEPREPSGNGVAYDRFLGIYRELETGTGSTRTHGKA